MLYNIFPHPCKCTNTRLRRLRRHLYGVCNTTLPCYRNGVHKIRMYPGRGVLHTPPERFRRKRRGVPMHKNDHSPPPAAFLKHMLLRLYTIGKSEIKKRERIMYPCRGVLHTPHKYSIKEYFTLQNMCLRRLRRHLWGVCCCVPTILQE